MKRHYRHRLKLGSEIGLSLGGSSSVILGTDFYTIDEEGNFVSDEYGYASGSNVSTTNYFSNPSSPANHTSGEIPAGIYTLFVEGAGSIAVAAGTATGSGWGSAISASPRDITITVAGTVAFTVTAPVTYAEFLLKP